MASIWIDFLAWQGWLDERVFGRQAADWVRATYNLFRLRVRYGDRPDKMSF